VGASTRAQLRGNIGCEYCALILNRLFCLDRAKTQYYLTPNVFGADYITLLLTNTFFLIMHRDAF